MSHPFSSESNIYADKSAMVLDWLLSIGIDKAHFSLREISKETGISLGQVQKVLKLLVLHGLISSEGVRTAKYFFIKNPEALLKSWIENYNIVKKCTITTYASGLRTKEEMLTALENSDLKSKVSLALHSSVEAYGCKNTNLNTLELYILDPSIKLKLEEILELKPQERGYEVLLIEPYYKNLLKSKMNSIKDLNISPVLLTFLDLYHFPLRGIEQAEFMAQHVPELKRIFKKK